MHRNSRRAERDRAAATAPPISDPQAVRRRTRWRSALRRFAFGVTLLAAGCTGTTGHLAVASTRAVDLQSLGSDSPARHAVGRSCIDLIVVVPTRMPNFGDAIAEALRATGGEALTNVRIGYEIVYVPFVYGVACYVVEGDAR